MGFAVDQSTLREWAGKGLVKPEAVGLPSAVAPEGLDAGEKQFQADVVKHAKRNGWRVYHTFSSKRSEPGFPDLILLRAGTLIVAELKASKGKPTPEQLEWLEAFQAAGVAAYLWRPADWPAIADVLGTHQRNGI